MFDLGTIAPTSDSRNGSCDALRSCRPAVPPRQRIAGEPRLIGGARVALDFAQRLPGPCGDLVGAASKLGEAARGGLGVALDEGEDNRLQLRLDLCRGQLALGQPRVGRPHGGDQAARRHPHLEIARDACPLAVAAFAGAEGGGGALAVDSAQSLRGAFEPRWRGRGCVWPLAAPAPPQAHYGLGQVPPQPLCEQLHP
jgi:hypothetical protein